MTMLNGEKKAMFFDVDGTIIDCARGLQKIPERTEYFFRELKQKNCMVIISSGRSKSLIDKEIKKCSPNGYILANGASIELEDGFKDSALISSEQLMMAETAAEKNNGICLYETGDGVFTHSNNQTKIKSFMSEWNIPDLAIQTVIGFKTDVYKLLTVFQNKSDFYYFYNEVKNDFDCRQQKDHYAFDITLPNVNKGRAINMILEHTGITKDNAYAFGDGDNDTDMFQSVGHGIAVSNASEMLKRNADEVCGDVLEDGIYYWLVNNGFINAL